MLLLTVVIAHAVIGRAERAPNSEQCKQEKCNVVGAMGISGMGGVEHETLSAYVIWLTRTHVVRDHKADSSYSQRNSTRQGGKAGSTKLRLVGSKILPGTRHVS